MKGKTTDECDEVTISISEIPHNSLPERQVTLPLSGPYVPSERVLELEKEVDAVQAALPEVDEWALYTST